MSSDPMIEKLVRFQRPDRVLGYARGLSDTTLAALFGTDETTYRATLADLDARRAATVRALAGDATVRADLERVPFTPGQHLVAIGESSTADRLSWFELLRELLTAERPDLRLRFDNLAVTSATTTQTLAGMPQVRGRLGDWVFCMLGTNDAQRFGSADGARLVSEAETARNLREIRAQARLGDGARWVWVTPTPVEETLVARFPFFRGAGITWSNHDLAAPAAELSASGDQVIDSASAVAPPDAFLDDGLHPSVATHQRIAARVLAALAG